MCVQTSPPPQHIHHRRCERRAGRKAYTIADVNMCTHTPTYTIADVNVCTHTTTYTIADVNLAQGKRLLSFQ